MKKQTIIFFFVITMVLSFAAVVSAESNQEYYDLIDYDLLQIYAGAVNYNLNGVKDVMSDLRDDIYDCSRYLTEKGEYSAGLAEILWLVSSAVESQSSYTASVVANARCSLANILLKTTPDFCAYPYYGAPAADEPIHIPPRRAPRPHS